MNVSSTAGVRAPYIAVRWVRVTYPVLRLNVCSPIQEKGDAGIVTPGNSPVQGGSSILRTHTQ